MTVQAVYDFVNNMAPFETQECYDNAGLLVGDPDWEVRGVYVALDVTSAVLDEAEAAGINLILSHHPLMFTARKRLVEMDSEAVLLCRMIRNRMALIAAHTNWDLASGGINDVLAALLGLENVTGESYLRVGNLPSVMCAEAFCAQASAVLGDTVRLMGHPDQEIRRVGVVGGAASEMWQQAHALGADAFLTGEMKHHHALAAVETGMVALEAGHFATEVPGIFALADALQNHFHALQYKIPVFKSRARRYG